MEWQNCEVKTPWIKKSDTIGLGFCSLSIISQIFFDITRQQIELKQSDKPWINNQIT